MAASATQNDGKNEMADAAQPMSSQGKGQPADKPQSALPPRSTPPPKTPAGGLVSARDDGGFFTIYKKGQGYWTRIGTVGGAALIAILTAQFIYSRMSILSELHPRSIILIVAAFLAVFALITFRIVNRPTVVDFLIATDSEMKKVNWTTRAELIGSTKVVIFFMLLIMVLLFFFDTVFGYFFEFIHVLKFGPFG